MDSLKEKDNPAPNPSKRPHIEADEEMTRRTGSYGLANRYPYINRIKRKTVF